MSQKSKDARSGVLFNLRNFLAQGQLIDAAPAHTLQGGTEIRASAASLKAPTVGACMDAAT